MCICERENNETIERSYLNLRIFVRVCVCVNKKKCVFCVRTYTRMGCLRGMICVANSENSMKIFHLKF